MEILGVEALDRDEEKFYELDDRYIGLTHNELLASAVAHFDID
jgi:hypothetical protein